MADVFALRFDLRAPVGVGGPSAADLYATALEMCRWADDRGVSSIVLSEHHGVDDGYLPSPMVMAGAVAAVTRRALITVAALPLPLYDPVRLGEEMVVLDTLSRGRMFFVAALGYRREEYERQGVDFARRGRIADELLPVLLAARSGDAFDHAGRTVRVTPSPYAPGGPLVAWGGGSLAAARRAGRHGIGFFGQGAAPGLAEAYAAAAREAGHEPGLCYLPAAGSPTTVFVAEDVAGVDRAWDELGPYLLHEVRSYAEWNEGDATTASLSHVTTVDELRALQGAHRILTVDEAVAAIRRGLPLPLHPLIGGLPPEIAWRYLEVVGEQVLPALADAPGRADVSWS